MSTKEELFAAVETDNTEKIDSILAEHPEWIFTRKDGASLYHLRSQGYRGETINVLNKYRELMDARNLETLNSSSIKSQHGIKQWIASDDDGTTHDNNEHRVYVASEPSVDEAAAKAKAAELNAAYGLTADQGFAVTTVNGQKYVSISPRRLNEAGGAERINNPQPQLPNASGTPALGGADSPTNPNDPDSSGSETGNAFTKNMFSMLGGGIPLLMMLMGGMDPRMGIVLLLAGLFIGSKMDGAQSVIGGMVESFTGGGPKKPTLDGMNTDKTPGLSKEELKAGLDTNKDDRLDAKELSDLTAEEWERLKTALNTHDQGKETDQKALLNSDNTFKEVNLNAITAPLNIPTAIGTGAGR